MVAKTALQHRSSPKRARAALTAMFVLGGAAACSSTGPKTEVKGEVITREDPNLGGPNPAVAEHRAGERSSYGSHPALD